MRTVSSADVQRNFGQYREIAQGLNTDPEPVMVQHYNKPSVVILSADEYARLKERDREVILTEDAPDWLIEGIENSRMDPRHDHLNDEV